MTIHRLLNYQSYINTDTGDKYFAKSSVNPNWSMYDLIVIDECSMLSNQIIYDINDLIINNAYPKLKIIYVGDPAQLPPVNQKDSQIFNKLIKKLSLENIIRTTNQEIMNLSNDHRKWIFSKNDEDIPQIFKYLCDNIKIYSIDNKETIKWLNSFITNINYNIENNKIENNNIILTWTNKKCNTYNKYIREKLFNKKDLDHYEIGEILIFNDFHRILKENDNLEDKNEYINFYTSEQIKLININKIKYKFEQIKFKINNSITKELNDIFRNKYILINKLIDIEITIYDMQIEKISNIDNEKKNEYKINSIHPESEKVFNKIIEEFELIINKLKKDCYKIINDMNKVDNMTKSNFQAEVEKKINKLYKDWQEKIIDIFAQLNYGYCITVHKSQGSTFKNVFIDISDILDNKNIEETSKCLYTAITRSSSTIQLLV